MATLSGTIVHTLLAGAKALRSRLRDAGALTESADWLARAETCERCPLRVVQCNVSYCGRPFLQQVHRDPVLDGCGCPTRAKAKDPSEHCPIDRSHNAARRDGNGCTCKWCTSGKV